jgi:hypothetical protein
VPLRWVLVLGTDYFRASRPIIVRTDGGLLSVSPRISGTVMRSGGKVVMKRRTVCLSDLTSNKSIRLPKRLPTGTLRDGGLLCTTNGGARPWPVVTSAGGEFAPFKSVAQAFDSFGDLIRSLLLPHCSIYRSSIYP